MPQLYNETRPPAEPPLQLRTYCDGDVIRLTIVDDKGFALDRGRVLVLDSDGKLLLYSGIDPTLARRAGIKIDSCGKIVTK
jgi:hypothetical protein